MGPVAGLHVSLPIAPSAEPMHKIAATVRCGAYCVEEWGRALCMLNRHVVRFGYTMEHDL